MRASIAHRQNTEMPTSKVMTVALILSVVAGLSACAQNSRAPGEGDRASATATSVKDKSILGIYYGIWSGQQEGALKLSIDSIDEKGIIAARLTVYSQSNVRSCALFGEVKRDAILVSPTFAPKDQIEVCATDTAFTLKGETIEWQTASGIKCSVKK
jgi:hypothetical protein